MSDEDVEEKVAETLPEDISEAEGISITANDGADTEDIDSILSEIESPSESTEE